MAALGWLDLNANQLEACHSHPGSIAMAGDFNTPYITRLHLQQSGPYIIFLKLSMSEQRVLWTLPRHGQPLLRT